jgi:hypothetical protein
MDQRPVNSKFTNSCSTRREIEKAIFKLKTNLLIKILKKGIGDEIAW